MSAAIIINKRPTRRPRSWVEFLESVVYKSRFRGQPLIFHPGHPRATPRSSSFRTAPPSLSTVFPRILVLHAKPPSLRHSSSNAVQPSLCFRFSHFPPLLSESSPRALLLDETPMKRIARQRISRNQGILRGRGLTGHTTFF